MSLSAEDSLAILQLVTEADECASARDAEGYVELFTEDGVMTDSTGTAAGRAELVATVASVWFEEPSGTLHLTLNPTIDDTEDEPTVHSVMLVILPNGSPRILHVARIRQTMRCTPDGWRIAVRETLTGAG